MQYQRAVLKDLVRLFARGGPLHDLTVDPGAAKLSGDGREWPIDVQLRGKDGGVHFSVGNACLLRVNSRKPAGVALGADERFQRHGAEGLFAKPQLPESGPELREVAVRWWPYLEKIPLDAGRVSREERWRARLAHRFGPRYAVGDPFCAIDTQAALGFENKAQRAGALDPLKTADREIRARIRADERMKKAYPRLCASRLLEEGEVPNQVDLLAVSAEGDLVLCEVRAGDDADGVALSPLSLGMYAELWHSLAARAGRESLAREVNLLIAQKKEMGLLPRYAPELAADFEIRPALAIGQPQWRDRDTWGALRRIWHLAATVRPGLLDLFSVVGAVERNGDIATDGARGHARDGLPWW